MQVRNSIHDFAKYSESSSEYDPVRKLILADHGIGRSHRPGIGLHCSKMLSCVEQSFFVKLGAYRFDMRQTDREISMRMRTLAILVFGCAAFTSPVRAADDADTDAKKIVEKAIEAHGGEAELKKLYSVSQKIKGTLQVMGMDIPFNGNIFSTGEELARVELAIEVMNMKFNIVHVVNKSKGWSKFADETKDLTKEQIEEAREQAHGTHVATLAPLKDSAYKVSLVGDDKVNDKDVTVIRVTKKDRRDVTLFFDKKTYLLLKQQMRVKDEMSGQEMDEERFYDEYNEKGLRQPKKMTIKRDGKPYMEAEISDLKTDEKFDDSSFEKP